MDSNRLHPSNLAQTTASILTMVKSHVDRWETISHKDKDKDKAKLNITKDEKTCMTLMTA
jgi:hypothetical protein